MSASNGRLTCNSILSKATRLNAQVPSRLLLHRAKGSLVRPGPPLLAPEQQKEFEELVRQAQGAPVATKLEAGADQKHPDARTPVQEFTGDVNPKTGERGGPKQEPTSFGDWSFGGKVTDF